MNKTFEAKSGLARSPARASAPVRILALTTAVPEHELAQGEVEAFAASVFSGESRRFQRLRPAFANAGVARRRACVPLAWISRPQGWAERARVFAEHAVPLAERVARACLAGAGLGVDDVDAVVAVSSTGIATPSLDALVVERMGLRRNVERLPIFGLGCAGGVSGLARAAAMARARPASRVLLVVVELCAPTFRRADTSKSNIIAAALFGDGAAGAILTTGGGSAAEAQEPGSERQPRVIGWAEHTWPNTLDVMGWRIEDDGFGVLFSRDIPAIVTERLRCAAEEALLAHGLGLADIDRFVCHPGGSKVVAALEDAFALSPGALDDAREVLREYGNMSAPSVMFVLERALARERRRRIRRPRPRPERWLLSALGPGFTASFLILEVP